MKPRWHDTDERPGSTCQCELLCGDEEGETFEWYYIAAIYDSKKDQFQIPRYHCDNSLFAYRCHPDEFHYKPVDIENIRAWRRLPYPATVEEHIDWRRQGYS